MNDESEAKSKQTDARSDQLEHGKENNTLEQIGGLETTNAPSQTKNMEVHHHPHVEKKNFKEYFLEFIMIFLAVTLGFFAENIREWIGNNEKETHYMQSLVSDLRADTLDLRQAIMHERIHYNMLDSALNIPIGSLANVAVQDSFFHYLFLYYSLTTNFNQSKSAIAQLKTGGFNVIRDKSVVDSINQVYQLFDLLESNDKYLEKCYWDFAHMAQNVLRLPRPATTWDDPAINIILKDKEIFLVKSTVEIEKLYNVIGNATGSFKTDMIRKEDALKKATLLISYLQQHYHLES